MKKVVYLFLVFVNLKIFGQSGSFRIAPSFEFKSASVPAVFNKDTLKIFALMVEFQADQDDATAGNGKFGSLYSKDYGNDIIDPYPHDKHYFESKLLFAKNYFEKNSKGKLKIQYKVFDDVITVSKIMRSYSPPPRVNDIKPMAIFAKEAFDIFDSLYSNYNISEYDMFIIFHAGIGRDVVIQGQINIERNLPSIFYSLNSLRGIFGGSFNGFKVSNSYVTNVAILPTTENREVSTLGGKTLIEISNNGLICSMIGSFLGLPDLYNTETGTTAIGRMGLMDGQSIFAYNGAFPPALSAWEKIYLGWESPFEITSPGIYNVKSFLKESTEPSIFKLKITEEEYFLIECRLRDFYGDNCNITARVGGEEILIANITDKDIRSYDISYLRGVIVDVDEFDFALPGEGILIWKINERVIREKLPINKINADKFEKGVMLVEADGIFEIGEKFKTIFGEEIYGEGTKEDFWHRKNKSIFYRNLFNDDTRPNTRLSSGARSFIELLNFSDISSLMSFEFRKAQKDIKLLFEGKIFSQSRATRFFPSDKNDQLVIFNDKNLYSINFQTLSLSSLYDKFSEDYPAFVSLSESNGKSRIIAGAYKNKINVFIEKPDLTREFYEYYLNDTVTAQVSILSRNDSISIFAGSINGKVYELSFKPNYGLSLIRSFQAFNDRKVDFILQFSNKIIFVGGDILAADDNITLKFDASIKDIYGVVSNNKLYLYALQNDNVMNIYKSDSISIVGMKKIYSKTFNSEINSVFIDNDFKGEHYFIYPEGSNVYGFNSYGSLATNFPFKIEKTSAVHLFASLKENFVRSNISSAKRKLFAFGKDGSIYLFNLNTASLEKDFPIAGLSNPAEANLLKKDDGNILICVSDSDGRIRIFEILNSENFELSNFCDAKQKNLRTLYIENYLVYDELMPSSRTYNWPNPIYDGKTYFRVYVQEESEVSISIYDLTGILVGKLAFKAPANFDFEKEYDVSNLAKGIYLAKITARSNSGKTSQKILKIAVVK